MIEKKRPGPKNYGEDAPPALYIHCVRTYNKMLERATDQIVSPIEPDLHMIIYEGFFVRLVAELGLSTPYFTFCRQALIDMGCIRQIKRGGGTGRSQWELIKAPTLELFDEKKLKDPNYEKLERKGKQEMMQDQINALNNRVLDLEKFRDGIINGAS